MIRLTNFLKFISFILIYNNNVTICIYESVTFKISDSCERNSKCTKEELEYLAISKLHDQIDDDKNGDIDITESKDFVKESLSNAYGTDRAKKFHNADAHIDKQDLWQIWKTNEVYNWTTFELINWLKVDVELPQFEDAFLTLKLNGSSLSRLTDNDFLLKVVKIENSIHRKKIMIKAMDMVLFGQQKRNQMSNTSILGIILFFTSVIIYLIVQNIYSKRFVQTMKTKLNYLSETEENLSELRNKLKIVEDVRNQKDSEIQEMKERHRQEITKAINSSRESLIDDSDKSKSQQEILKLRSSLHEAHVQINHLMKKSASLPSNNDLSKDNMLHLLLQLTHAIESQYLAEKISLIDHQSSEFMELNERVKKKKTAFLGTFRIIHSSDMDNIEKGFACTKRAYEKIIYEKKDKEYRWSQIENIIGVNLTTVVDINNLRQTISMVFGDLSKKEHTNSPLLISNSEISDSSLTPSISEPRVTAGSEGFFKNCENPIRVPVDDTDHTSYRNIEESVQEKPMVLKSNIKLKEDTILMNRFRKDHHINKKKHI